jgi:hypothetical protein
MVIHDDVDASNETAWGPLTLSEAYLLLKRLSPANDDQETMPEPTEESRFESRPRERRGSPEP